MKLFALEPDNDPDLKNLSLDVVQGIKAGLANPEEVRWLQLSGGLMGGISDITLPDDLRAFPILEVLEVEYYFTVHLTEVLADLPRLQTLILLGNEFHTEGTALDEPIRHASKLQALYLDCFYPLTLTEHLLACTSLRKIWIDDCEVHGLDLLGEMTALEELSIDADVSAQLPRMKGLKHLRLLRRKPPPECIQDLPLETLALHGLSTPTLPPWVGQMPTLRTLDLFQSDVAELPDGLQALQGLRITNSPLASKIDELRERFPHAEIVE